MFDGLLVHIAGGKRGGDFNQRFGQPSSTLHPSMSDLFPFTDTAQTDPETGRTDGLLERLAARQKLPKIFLTNSSTEYWRGDASLSHTDVQGTRDVPPSASVRMYHYAGTQHASGTLPLTNQPHRRLAWPAAVQLCGLHAAAPCRPGAAGSVGDRPGSPTAKPASVSRRRHGGPTRANGSNLPAIPGVQFPTHLPRVVRLDFGPEAEAGIATHCLPAWAKPIPTRARSGCGRKRAERDSLARHQRPVGNVHGMEWAPS